MGKKYLKFCLLIIIMFSLIPINIKADNYIYDNADTYLSPTKLNIDNIYIILIVLVFS